MMPRQPKGTLLNKTAQEGAGGNGLPVVTSTSLISLAPTKAMVAPQPPLVKRR